MNRYNYNSNNRRRTYGSTPSTTNGSSAVLVLVFLLIVMIAWILSLKADVSNISDRNFELKKQNDSLVVRIDSLNKKPEPIKVPVVEIKPKKVLKRPIKDTVKSKPILDTEVKNTQTVVDTTGF
jgi:hypothetical protein